MKRTNEDGERRMTLCADPGRLLLIAVGCKPYITMCFARERRYSNSRLGEATLTSWARSMMVTTKVYARTTNSLVVQLTPSHVQLSPRIVPVSYTHLTLPRAI